MTRVMALDHGSARCGVAVTDPTLTIVTPLPAIDRPDTDDGLRAIVDLVSQQAADRVVVGLPLALDGSRSAQTLSAEGFAARLGAALGEIPVELADERLTTRSAAELGGQADPDSRAAAVLLVRWLEGSRR